MGKLFSTLKNELVEKSKSGISLELRLVILFLVFLITIMLCISLILISTGVFKAGVKENTALFEKELSYINNGIYDYYRDTSLRSIFLAENLSKNIEGVILENGVIPSELFYHPDLLETILNETFDKLLIELQYSKNSGIFLILNATINPDIAKAEYSRAGIFLKNMEAGSVNSLYYDIRYMRGPSSIGRSNGITILPQWEMEFAVSKADYFTIPIHTATESNLPLSRLYYWCPKVQFDNSDSAMLCSVPLIASDGTLLGVTGFEVGSMLFKSNYAPDNSMQNRIFCMLAPYDGTYLNLENAMFAGSHVVRGLIPSTKMKVLTDKEGFHQYIDESNNTYLGFDRKVRLYANDSPYEQEEWRVVLLVPEIDINGKIMHQNRLIISLLVLLTAVFAVLAILISRKYLQPIRKAFDAIKLKKINEHNKTRIPEIDDLIEYLTKQDDKLIGDTFDFIAHNTTIFESFVNNIKTLSIAEKVVFDLYMKGHTSKEIANILCLSINTIKTHNRRIYTKLNISSRKELLVYTQMMNELKQEKNKKKEGC
ncbi:MAG: LuxR C-terminal-related transcriptional regulator [Parabacteroides sp.]|nr:LuxR C-terminal-related transcriptional regulator [Parabacteroides sp.]